MIRAILNPVDRGQGLVSESENEYLIEPDSSKLPEDELVSKLIERFGEQDWYFEVVEYAGMNVCEFVESVALYGERLTPDDEAFIEAIS